MEDVSSEISSPKRRKGQDNEQLKSKLSQVI